VDVLLRARQDVPEVPDDALQNDVVESVARLRLRNLQRQIQDLRFVMEDARQGAAEAGVPGLGSGARDGGEATYGPLIAQLAARIRRLQKALTERSVAGRRRQTDVPVRVPHADE
jgi:small-conductance mechanosensitive channel